MTTALVKFTCAGAPVTQGSKRAFVVNGRATLVESGGDKLRLWRHVMAMSARGACEEPLEGAVVVHLWFRMDKPAAAPKLKRTWPIKKRSGDVDKLARAALDAMTGVVFHDDSQVVKLVVEKDWSDGRGPGVEVIVIPVREEQ